MSKYNIKESEEKINRCKNLKLEDGSLDNVNDLYEKIKKENEYETQHQLMKKANTKEIELRYKIIKIALLQYQKKYVHGNNGPYTFDCAGLVWFVYNQIFNINLYENGFGLSTTTKIMTNNFGKLTIFDENSLNKDLSLIKYGDIVFFHRQALNDEIPKVDNKYPGHCGIYLGNNNFIHCSRSKGKVVISNFIENEYWKSVLVASKDIFLDNNLQYKK